MLPGAASKSSALAYTSKKRIILSGVDHLVSCQLPVFFLDMKKWIVFILFSVLVFALFALPSAAYAQTFTIDWIDDLTFKIPYDAQRDHYHVWYSLDGGATWTGWLSIDNEDFTLVQRDYYPVSVLDVNEAMYYVSAENVTNPDSIYTSNSLTRTLALFELRAFDYSLEWDNVDNVVTYQVQVLSMATNQWSTLATYNRTHVNYTPSGSYSGYSFRIRALLADGKYWYSNTVTWYYYAPDQSFDMSGAVNPPRPEISGPDYTITVWPEITYSEPQYNKALQVLGSGIYNSKLGPYVLIAFGLLGSFAIVGYLAFRMH